MPVHVRRHAHPPVPAQVQHIGTSSTVHGIHNIHTMVSRIILNLRFWSHMGSLGKLCMTPPPCCVSPCCCETCKRMKWKPGGGKRFGGETEKELLVERWSVRLKGPSEQKPWWTPCVWSAASAHFRQIDVSKNRTFCQIKMMHSSAVSVDKSFITILFECTAASPRGNYISPRSNKLSPIKISFVFHYS